MNTEELPLFPLSAVLLPGGRLPLQIFEPRYLDLVSHCMKTDSGFGIVRITSGHEVIIAQGTTPPATADRCPTTCCCRARPGWARPPWP